MTVTVMGTAMTTKTIGKGNNGNGKEDNDGKEVDSSGGSIPVRQTTIN